MRSPRKIELSWFTEKSCSNLSSRLRPRRSGSQPFRSERQRIDIWAAVQVAGKVVLVRGKTENSSEGKQEELSKPFSTTSLFRPFFFSSWESCPPSPYLPPFVPEYIASHICMYSVICGAVFAPLYHETFLGPGGIHPPAGFSIWPARYPPACCHRESLAVDQERSSRTSCRGARFSLVPHNI